MAINAPFGLQPVLGFSGANYNGRVSRYYIPTADANRYNLGDAVLSAAGADANGVPQIVKATVGTETLRGVMVAIEPFLGNANNMLGAALPLELAYVPAVKTHDYYVMIADDPEQVFMIQGDATAANQIAANANKNFSLTITNPAGNVPASASVLNSASIAVTQALNMKLIGLAQIVGNGFGAFAIWLCKINQHELGGNTAGV